MVPSDAGWIGLGKIDFVMRPPLERLERRRLVEMEDCVELVAKSQST